MYSWRMKRSASAKPRPADSHSNMNAILQAACSTGCDAIHPGFGFLSENPQFAALVEQCGLILSVRVRCDRKAGK